MAINAGVRRFGQHFNQNRTNISAPAWSEGAMLHIDIPTLAEFKEAGADKKRIAVFEERFEHLAGPEHDVQDEDKIRKLQRAKPDPIEAFWHYQANGLAVLATSNMMRTLRLPNRPKPLAEVADRLHLTPLIRAMTSPHDVYVLALAEER